MRLKTEGQQRENVVVARRHRGRPAPARARNRRNRPAGAATLLAIPLFMLLCVAVALWWPLPAGVARFVAGGYLVASAACFIAYAIDKSAAGAGRQRVPEKTLHLLGAAGGWPGALLAQQLLRHKSSKASFRLAFWGTVGLNVLGFAAATTPLLGWLRR